LRTFNLEKELNKSAGQPAEGMDPLFFVATLFAAFNVVLLSGLIYLYARILRRTQAGYSAGLLIFAVLLFFHNIVTLFAYAFMGSFYSDQLYPVLTVITVCEFGGILALVKVTL
jgi:hypothetical protein